MRIVFVTGSLEIGGAETQMVRLAAELVERGHWVHVICVVQAGPLTEDLERAGVTWELGDWLVGSRWGLPANFDSYGLLLRELISLPTKPVRQIHRARRIRQMWRHLDELEPDVCHALLPGAIRTMMIGAWLHKVPARVGGRRSLSSVEDRHVGLSALTAVTNLCTSLVIANSNEVAADARRVEWIRPRRIEVVFNGVEIPEATADVGGDEPLGLVVANLRPAKGHVDLLEAMAQLDSPPRMHFLGDGPHREAVEAAVVRLGLTHRVVLEGQVPGAAKRYLDAQFAVLPSHVEGLPNAVLEAMAAGLPVIATDVGGVRDLMEHGVHGLVVPPHRPDLLAQALRQLLEDEELRRRLGAAARARALEFAWSACTDRHLDLYEELVAVGARRRRRTAGALVQSPGSAHRRP